MWYSGSACNRNALAAARFCVGSAGTLALPLLGLCVIVPEAPRVDWPVGLGAGDADAPRRPTPWRVSPCALGRFHRASQAALFAAGTDGPGGLSPAFSSEDATKWRLWGRGQSERWGKAGGGCSEERVSELILGRSSLRARVRRCARFPDQPSCALRQHPLQLLGITWLGLCSVRGEWRPWEVCCPRDQGVCGSGNVAFPSRAICF